MVIMRTHIMRTLCFGKVSNKVKYFTVLALKRYEHTHTLCTLCQVRWFLHFFDERAGEYRMGGETVPSSSISSVRHFFVVNPVCFDSRQKMETVVAGIHRFFDGLGNSLPGVLPGHAVHVSRFPRDAIGAIRRFASAVPSGAPLRVYAVGGDGILFDCLNGVVGLPNVELGIMPYGRHNDFYRVFGEKNRSIFNSLRMQLSAPSVPVDVICCSGNYALSHCHLGLEPLASANIRKMREYFFIKWLVPAAFPNLYVNYICLVGAARYSAARQNYHLWVDGEDLSGIHLLIHILNSSWYGGNLYFPDADPTDGCLDVVMSGDMGVLRLFKKANKVLRALNEFKAGDKYITGYYEKYPDLIAYRRAKTVLLTSEEPLMFNLDGELFYDKNVTVEIKPGAVRVIVPNFAFAAGARP